MNSWEEVLSLLKDPAFDRILVACHRSPDGDACGSSFALSSALRKMGRQARVFCPDPFGEDFSQIVQVERDLPFFEPEHFITVDIASPEMLCGAPFADKIDLVLDHHRVNTVSGTVKFVNPEAASCGEIVLEIIRALNVPMDRFLALALYTAISTDTGCFRYSNTNENTFLAAAFLSGFVERGDFYRINKRFFETKSRARLMLESFAAQSVTFFAEGRLAVLSVSLARQKELGASYEELDVLVNVIRQIKGVQVCFVIKEKEPGSFRVSVRSEEGFDAADFCAFFGGGGHLAAAGCTVQGEESQVVDALVCEAERRLV